MNSGSAYQGTGGALQSRISAHPRRLLNPPEAKAGGPRPAQKTPKDMGTEELAIHCHSFICNYLI
jgi:hypothetical protein